MTTKTTFSIVALLLLFAVAMLAAMKRLYEHQAEAAQQEMQVIHKDGWRCLIAPDGYAVCEREAQP